MVNPEREPLCGVVEADETIIPCPTKNDPVVTPAGSQRRRQDAERPGAAGAASSWECAFMNRNPRVPASPGGRSDAPTVIGAGCALTLLPETRREADYHPITLRIWRIRLG
jgi:hypothetical protein